MTADVWQFVVVALITVAALGVWGLMRRSSLIPEAEARRLRSAGAVVIDVRSRGEYATGHLPGVINVPLDGIGAAIGGVVPDRSTPVLLHCHSGGRSGIARMLLRRAGYPGAHNLGSYGRAQRILSEPAPKSSSAA